MASFKNSVAVSLLIAALSASADTACPELTTAQVIVGSITPVGVLLFFATIATVAAALYMLSGLKEIAADLWKLVRPFSDVLAFIATGVYLYVIKSNDSDIRTWLAFIGAIFFAASLTWCLHLRVEKRENKLGYFLLLLSGFVPLAIYFNSEPVGYLAAIALIGAMRFTIIVSPLVYSFGYESDEDLASGTSSSLMTLAAFLVLYLSIRSTPSLDVIKVFVHGVFWTTSIAGFIGLLILSSKWVAKENYVINSLIAIGTFVIASVIGVQFHIPGLVYMGLLMSGLWGAGKISELPTKGHFAIGLKIAVIAGLLWFAAEKYKENKVWIDSFASSTIPM